MSPNLGVLVKTKPDTKCTALVEGAPIPMEELPKRPADTNGRGGKSWYDGTDWVYAGASPISPYVCTTPRGS